MISSGPAAGETAGDKESMYKKIFENLQEAECFLFYEKEKEGTPELATRNFGRVFEVKKDHSKQLGIDWNTNRSPYTCKGNLFCPFSSFADNVIFEDIETGKKYHFSDPVFSLVENTSEPI